jgi:CheY-like chemotaxis protein
MAAELEAATILLVEDNKIDVEVLRLTFRRARLRNPLMHVRDGQEALDYLFHQGAYADPDRHPAPDLLLLDLNLPRVHGLQVLQKVRASERHRSMPVVLMVSSAAEALRPELTGLTDTYLLVKPLDIHGLTGIIQKRGELGLLITRQPTGG